MNWIKSFPLLLVSLFLAQSTQVNACGYWEFDYEYQAMIFRAKLPQMDYYRPFEYTMGSVYGGELDSDPNETDRLQNCAEWRSACEGRAAENDIYQILYKTQGDIFIHFIQKKLLSNDLSENSFVKYLLKRSNKEMLDYLVFAKMVENLQFPPNARFESWDNRYIDVETPESRDPLNLDKTRLAELAMSRMDDVKSPFLTKRYAFQLCRFAYELSSTPNAAALHDHYFGKIKPNDLMSVWACLYKAHALKGKEAARAYVQVFMNCNEKKFRCVQLFEDWPMPVDFTNPERSAYNQIRALTNPGRALDQLKNVLAYNPKNDGLPFLVEREINKLEDWLITPVFYANYAYGNDSPFKGAFYNPWLEQFKDEPGDSITKANAKLHSTDMLYLAELKGFVKQVFTQSSSNERDFYALALAHLAILEEKGDEAKSYMEEVSNNALPTLQFQKEVEQLWLAMKMEDTQSESFKELFASTMQKIQGAKIGGVNKYKTLFGLSLSLANAYLKGGDVVFGNLLRLRANYFREKANWGDEYLFTDYNRLNSNKFVYFWNNASPKDIDKLLDLATRNSKTQFEKFVSEGTLLDKEWYYDLKGTIAFRNNDLQAAYESFSKLSPTFWTENSYFTNCLNENPFEPKGLQPDSMRKYKYLFDKTSFVKSLLDLENKAKQNPKKASGYYSQLGNAFFNTSYWGNAWMMSSYSWSVNDLFYSETAKLPAWMQDYMMAQHAQHYFNLALKTATDNEQKAYANLMLHYISRLSADYRKSELDKHNATMFGKAFKALAFTKTYKTYDCPGIESFLQAER